MSKLIHKVLEHYKTKAQQYQRHCWKEGERTVIRASATNSCLRSLWYDLNGYDPLPRSIDIVRAGQEGMAHQEQMRKTLREAGIDIRDDEQEVEVDAGEFVVRGHIDNKLYEFDVAKAILDYKRESAIDNPYWKHRPQMACYLAGTGLPEAIVLIDAKHQGYKPFRYFESLTRSKKGHFQSDFLSEVVIKNSPFYFQALIRSLAPIKYYQPNRLEETEIKDGFKIYPWTCFYCHFSKECRPKSFVAKIKNRFVLAEKAA